MKSPDPRKESKQTILRRLLRRRGRSSKPRANSREPVMMRVRESKIYVTPSSDTSGKTGWVWSLVLILMFAFCFALGQVEPATIGPSGTPLNLPTLLLYGFVALLAGITFLLSVWVMATALIRIVSNWFPRKPGD
jgi:hypothetical protein